MLVAQAIRHKDVTYTNVSPAPHTRPIIEAQGFSRYSDGVFVAITALNGLFGGRKAEVIDATKQPDIECDPFDREVLLQHAALGCDSLWCVASGQASPFVFRPRLVKGHIPCAQLIYCRDVGDFVRFAGPIGRFLGQRGKFFVVIDANGPITRAGRLVSAAARCRSITRGRNARVSEIWRTPSTRCLGV